MGSRRFSELTGIRPPGDSHEIQAYERRHQLNATLSYLNAKHEVEFGDEVPVEQEFGWRQLPPKTEGDSEIRVWTGFEFRTRDPHLRDGTLVVATYPYFTDWFDWGDFKPILKRSRSECLQPLRAPEAELKESFRSRSKLPTERLESRCGWFTARLSMPTRTEGIAITARGRLRNRDAWTVFQSTLNRRTGGTSDTDLWCFGACLEFQACLAALRVSPQARRLLEKTEDGTLLQKRGLKGPSRSLPLGPTARKLGERVLESSMVKALAGSSPKLDKIRTSGKPPLAALLMERIYDDTIYSLAQRLEGEPDSGGRVHVTDLEAIGTETPGLPEFDDMAERLSKKFEKHSFDESARIEIEEFLLGYEPECITGCAFLAAALKAGRQVHRSFEPLLQRIARDPGRDIAVCRAARKVLDLMRGSGPPAD